MANKPARKIHLKVVKDKYTDKPNVVLSAVNQLVDFVSPTLGPKIRHILVDMGYKTELMDDGVSIAKEFELEDEFEDAVAAYVKEASEKTDRNAGDGTTTTMVILRRLLAELIESGKSYPEIRAELAKAVPEAVAQIKAQSVKVESRDDLYKVAKTSMDDEQAAGVVADVVWTTGAKGAVTITDHPGRNVEYERVEGFVFNRGMIARGMMNNKEKQLYEAPNHNFKGDVAIAVVEETISTTDQIVPILEAADQKGCKNVAIFCNNLIGEALGVVALNQARGAFNIVAVGFPGQGDKIKDFVQDVCAVTGATLPVGTFVSSNLGSAASIKTTLDDTTIIGGNGDKGLIDAHVASLQAKADESKDDYDREYYHRRQARLTGGVVIIKVGGVTETELNLKLKKVEDAVNACKCAMEEGVAPGAGATLMRVESGSAMLDSALKEVHRTVCANAELEPSEGMTEARSSFNVITGDTGDFLEIGVVDAAKVLRSAVENAASIAQILFSVSGIITNKREE